VDAGGGDLDGGGPGDALELSQDLLALVGSLRETLLASSSSWTSVPAAQGWAAGTHVHQDDYQTVRTAVAWPSLYVESPR
jgi:hypothetical protein